MLAKVNVVDVLVQATGTRRAKSEAEVLAGSAGAFGPPRLTGRVCILYRPTRPEFGEILTEIFGGVTCGYVKK